MNRATIKPYVLIRKDATSNESHRRIVTRFADGANIGAAIGPFETEFAADLMADFGENNPHMQTVEDCERIAKTFTDRAAVAIELAANGEESDDITSLFDLLTDRGQIFGNVRHMAWLRDALAYQLFCDSDEEVQS